MPRCPDDRSIWFGKFNRGASDSWAAILLGKAGLLDEGITKLWRERFVDDLVAREIILSFRGFGLG